MQHEQVFSELRRLLLSLHRCRIEDCFPRTCNREEGLTWEMIVVVVDRGAFRIVLENSGVAEPSNIRDKFREAQEQGHPLLDRIYLDTLVTVVSLDPFSPLVHVDAVAQNPY